MSISQRNSPLVSVSLVWLRSLLQRLGVFLQKSSWLEGEADMAKGFTLHWGRATIEEGLPMDVETGRAGPDKIHDRS